MAFRPYSLLCMPVNFSTCRSHSVRIFISQFLFIFLLSGFVLSTSGEDLKSIRPIGYVTDLAGVISGDSRTRLENLCTELEQKAGAQMAIVTVRSLEGQTVERYANDLFKQLGVGSKKESRGVLLLVAPQEHKYWTEVGYGLEPVINDARAGDAGRAMVPFLRQGNYSGGIEAAARQLAGYIASDRGVTLSGAPRARPVETRRDDDSSSFPFWPILILILFVVRIIMAAIRNTSGRGGRGGGGWWIGMLIGNMLGGGGSSSGWGGGGFGGSSGGGGFGGFGGGSSGGGGAGGSW